MEDTKVSDVVMKDAADVLRALQLVQDGKTFATPVAGAYTIVVRKHMNFCGDAGAVAKLLAKAFPGCTFSW